MATDSPCPFAGDGLPPLCDLAARAPPAALEAAVAKAARAPWTPAAETVFSLLAERDPARAARAAADGAAAAIAAKQWPAAAFFADYLADTKAVPFVRGGGALDFDLELRRCLAGAVEEAQAPGPAFRLSDAIVTRCVGQGARYSALADEGGTAAAPAPPPALAFARVYSGLPADVHGGAANPCPGVSLAATDPGAAVLPAASCALLEGARAPLRVRFAGPPGAFEKGAAATLGAVPATCAAAAAAVAKAARTHLAAAFLPADLVLLRLEARGADGALTAVVERGDDDTLP